MVGLDFQLKEINSFNNIYIYIKSLYMKKLKQFYLKNEQTILFSSVIIYLSSLLFILNNLEWKEILWMVQFIGLGSLLVIKGKQKGWKWY
jgi:hypothetical protein